MSDAARRFRSDRKGAAAAEFALVVPLLAVLLFAFIEGGRMFWAYSIASAAARDAARFAARLPIDCSEATPISSANEGLVETLARTGSVSGSAALIAGMTADATVACVTNTAGYSGRYDGLTQIPVVNVTTTVPLPMLMPGLLGIPQTLTFTVSNQQAWTE